MGGLAVGHWEQIGAERRRRESRKEPVTLWRRMLGGGLMVAFAAALWAVVFRQLG